MGKDIDKARAERDTQRRVGGWTAQLVQMAQDGKRPLVGVTEDGIKWNDAEDNPQFLTLKNLRDRLRQKKKKAL